LRARAEDFFVPQTVVEGAGDVGDFGDFGDWAVSGTEDEDEGSEGSSIRLSKNGWSICIAAVEAGTIKQGPILGMGGKSVIAWGETTEGWNFGRSKE
jgi:hypothetical protein